MNNTVDYIQVEQEIMNCWGVVDDLATLLQALDRNASEDEIANIIIGIKDLYNYKFEHLFDKFSEMIAAMPKNNM